MLNLGYGINYDSSLEEKVKYIKEMQEEGIENCDILVPVESIEGGRRRIIHFLNVDEFIQKNPSFF